MAKKCFAFLFCLLAFPLRGFAEKPHVQVSLISETSSIQAGQPFWIAARFTMDPGWHIYWKDPGDSGIPTKIEWKLPPGFSAESLQWPVPLKIELPPLVNFGYEDEAILLARIQTPASFKSEKADIAAHVVWLECADVCIPGKADLRLTLPVTREVPRFNPDAVEMFARARSRIPPPQSEGTVTFLSALLFSFLGGLLLNLMPCVLPVLSIKVLGFVNQAGGDPRETRRHGLLFAAGVLVSFWILAGAILLLRAGGQQIGWGFQLQSPPFVAFLAALFFFLGLNMLGVFEMGASLMGIGNLTGRAGVSGSFFSGVLAAVVATPCTAPFMGAALGFTLTQRPAVSLIVFSSLGLGMAFPYLVLSFFPSLLRFVPRPGDWMETFKQALGFLLLATTVWLLWVLGVQAGVNALTILLIALLAVAVGCWIIGRWTGHLAYAVSILIIAGSSVWAIVAVGRLEKISGGASQTQTAVAWEPYSPQKAEDLQKSGRMVFIDFTAAWCLTCQVNELTTLRNEAVVRKFKDMNVAALKADWTNRDETITRALERYERSGVPLYVLLSPNLRSEPQILPAILTPSLVLKALEDKK